LVDWQVARLARIDRDLLRRVGRNNVFRRSRRVAINEAVELAKRYEVETKDAGFINGVLRRVSERIKAATYLS